MGKPKPFSRPGITLSTGVLKDWRDVPAHSLRENDMVRDFGRIVSITDSPLGLLLTFQSGTTLEIEEGETLLAFVAI